MASTPPKQASMAAEEMELKDALTKITIKAWTDDKFAELLRTQPDTALSSIGVKFPKHIVPMFHFDKGKERHFVIPWSPKDYLKGNVEYHLNRLAKLHVEFTSTSSWTKEHEE